MVDHYYSATAGAVSPFKAYYVERNRLYVLVKDFPAALALRAPGFTMARYFWHLMSVFEGQGAAARYSGRHGVVDLAFIAARAHCATLFRLRKLWRKRREVRGKAKLTPVEFRRLLEQHWITPRQVAVL
jgi:hypothetical protein